MKTLYLLRHAKSTWEYNVADHNRPLQEKGIQRIQKVAKAQAQAWNAIEVIFSSPANRALHTAVIAADQANFPFDRLRIAAPLYTFNAQEVLSFIKTLPNTYSKVMLVGHNPAFTTTATTLGDKTCPELKTASWACITFATSDWKDAVTGNLNWGITAKAE